MYIKTLPTLIALIVAGVIAGCSDNSSSRTSSDSMSPYTNVGVALARCADELRSDNNSGKYNSLSDYQMAKRMEADQESCMARYGHYPN